MEQDNVYIYQGLLDTITPWGIQKIALLIHHSAGVDTFSFLFYEIFVEDGQRIKYFYEQFLAAGKIEIKDDIFSEHGFVSFNNFEFQKIQF